MSWLDYAFRLLYLPIGLFGVALGTIATAGLARRAAEGDMDGPAAHAAAVPVDAGLPDRSRRRSASWCWACRWCACSTSAGRFTPADTEATAAALLLYSFGLVGYTGVKVLAPAFYALDAPRVPLAGQRLGGGDEPRR